MKHLAKEQHCTLSGDMIGKTKEHCESVVEEDDQSSENPKMEDKLKDDEDATHKAQSEIDNPLSKHLMKRIRAKVHYTIQAFPTRLDLVLNTT